ncbi:MAG: amidohydrolase family protein [Actinobacteria bacterium]|nr:amidohydrolase family protein [Actinomycetota bacterium]
MLRVDAHHHLWDLAARPQPWTAGHGRLERSFRSDDLRPLLQEQGIDATVLVHALADPAETVELLQLAGQSPEIAGVVGWVDLTSVDVAAQLAALQHGPGGEYLVGIRSLIQEEADPDWLGRPDVRRGLRAVAAAGLAYDLLVTVEQLAAAVRAAAALPEVVFVLDHAGNPSPGNEPRWAEGVRDLARLTNVSVKLSGLVTRLLPQRWSVAAVQPWAEQILDSFGPDRVMFGTDWPVCLLAASYAEVVALAGELVAGLAPAEREAVFGGTATRWYRLGSSCD